jgi:hypothetical protein
MFIASAPDDKTHYSSVLKFFSQKGRKVGKSSLFLLKIHICGSKWAVHRCQFKLGVKPDFQIRFLFRNGVLTVRTTSPT